MNRMGALISDVAMATSRARQRNGVVQRCAKAPRDVQNAARAAEMSVTNVALKFFKRVKHLWVLKFHTKNAFSAITSNDIIFKKPQPIGV